MEGFLMVTILTGVEGLSQRLANMRSFVQQQITTLTAKQVCIGARRGQVQLFFTDAWDAKGHRLHRRMTP